jgi:hypothetical protein
VAINDPRDISGLVVWYSAEAETGYSDGAQMTQWTDLSGNANHATVNGTTKPVWQATTGSGGGPSVRFGGAGWFTLPNVFSGATSGEMLMMVKSDNTNRDSWVFGAYTGSYASCHYPYDGLVYERFGMTGSSSSSDRMTFTPSLSVTAWRRYNAWAANNDFAVRMDATSQATDSSNAVGFPTTPAIGVTAISGALRTTSPWQGNAAAVVLYNRKLTTTERSDLDAWLAANPSGGTANNNVSGSLAATLPSLTASLSGTYNAPLITGTLAATLPSLTAALSGTGPAASITGSLAASIPALTAALSGRQIVEAEADTDDRANGRNRSGLAYAEVTEVLTTLPTREPHRSMAQSVPVPTLEDGRPL